MLTLEYLRHILQGEIAQVDNTEKQIIQSDAGYDGIISLIQTKGISPMIILENAEVGTLSFRPGGFSVMTQSIWVMKMVGRDDDRSKIQKECFKMMKRILSIMGKRNKDPELKEWEWDNIPWGARNAAANFTGYEFSLHFTEDVDLEYHGQE